MHRDPPFVSPIDLYRGRAVAREISRAAAAVAEEMVKDEGMDQERIAMTRASLQRRDQGGFRSGILGECGPLSVEPLAEQQSLVGCLRRLNEIERVAGVGPSQSVLNASDPSSAGRAWSAPSRTTMAPCGTTLEARRTSVLSASHFPNRVASQRACRRLRRAHEVDDAVVAGVADELHARTTSEASGDPRLAWAGRLWVLWLSEFPWMALLTFATRAAMLAPPTVRRFATD